PRTPPSPDHPPFPLTYRTSTQYYTREPVWNETWHLGGIPPDGFDLKIKVSEEDPDDKLGVANLLVPKLPEAAPDGTPGEVEERVLKIEKRKASRRVYATTYLVAWCDMVFKKKRGRVSSIT